MEGSDLHSWCFQGERFYAGDEEEKGGLGVAPCFLHSASVNAPDEEQQLTDPSLEAEFDAWEAASDEDLRRFEESLE